MKYSIFVGMLCACVIIGSNAHDSSSSSSSAKKCSPSRCAPKECLRAVSCEIRGHLKHCGYKNATEGTTCRRGSCDASGRCILGCPYNLPGYREFSNLPGTLTPDQPGPWAVGYTEIILGDPTRDNSNIPRIPADNTNPVLERKMFSRVWYPADASLPSTQPLAVYSSIPPTYNGQFSPTFSYLPSEQSYPSAAGARWLRTPAGSVGSRRLIMVHHTNNGASHLYRHLGEHLASHGYVVVAIQTTANDETTQFPGSVPASIVAQSPPTDSTHARHYDTYRTVDHIFGVATDASATNYPIFSLLTVTAGYGCYGHSAGGRTCLTLAGGSLAVSPAPALPRDPRVSAVYAVDIGYPINAAPVAYQAVFVNITVPVLLHGLSAENNGDLNLDKLVSAQPRYLLAFPGLSHFAYGYDQCEPGIVSLERTKRGRNYYPNTEPNAFFALTPALRGDFLPDVFGYCACEANKAALRAVPESVWAERNVSFREGIARLVDSIPTTSVPTETHANFQRGFAFAFFAANLAGDAAYAAYLAPTSVNSMFAPGRLVVGYQTTTASLNRTGNVLDVANGSSITFRPATEGRNGYMVQYHETALQPLESLANGSFGTLYNFIPSSFGPALQGGYNNVYPFNKPIRLALQFGFRLPSPSNRTQGQRISELWVNPKGRIHVAGFPEDNSGSFAPAQPADSEEGVIQRWGSFIFLPLHGNWQSVISEANLTAARAVFLINEPSRFVATWDRVGVTGSAVTAASQSTFQFVLLADGTVRYQYETIAQLARIRSSPLVRTSIASIGISDGRGFATEGGMHHSVDFTAIRNETFYSIGSVSEIFQADYTAVAAPLEESARAEGGDQSVFSDQ